MTDTEILDRIKDKMYKSLTEDTVEFKKEYTGEFSEGYIKSMETTARHILSFIEDNREGFTMRAFYVKYDSPGNITSKVPLIIHAESIGQAQDKFVEYLKRIGLWSHMWKLNVEFEEVDFVE